MNEVHENAINGSSGKQKKQRTEAQIRATEKMRERRQAELQNKDKDLYAAAEEMHNEKIKRQKIKNSEIEKILDSRLEKYHERFLDEINKPLQYWTSIFNAESVEIKSTPEPVSTIAATPAVPEPVRAVPEPVRAVPEQARAQTNQQEWELERLRHSDLNSKKRAAQTETYKQDFRQHHDFSQWLPKRR